MFLDTFTIRRCNLIKQTSKALDLKTNFNDFSFQRNMIFDDVLDLFRCKFWHLFLISCGINVGSILGPLWHQIPCFGVSVFLMNFRCNFWCKSDPTMVWRNICESTPFAIFLWPGPHTCTNYSRKTYKCQKLRFPIFFKKVKEVIHTCTFYSRKTYKCAVTVFTSL